MTTSAASDAVHPPGLEGASSAAMFARRLSIAGKGPAPTAHSRWLAEVADTFHTQAGTKTTAVAQAIVGLAHGAPLVRFAHQANLLPYANIFAHLVYGAAVADAMETDGVFAYFVVDYDIAQDRRFRSSLFPDAVGSRGVLPLTAGLSHHDRNTVQFALPPPSAETIVRWRAHCHGMINRDIGLLRRIGRREHTPGMMHTALEVLWSICDEARLRAATLPEFNAIVVSRIVNDLWGLPVLFLPLSRSLHDSSAAISELAAHVAELRNGYPAWIVCPACSARCSVDSWSDSGRTAGRCGRCAWGGSVGSGTSRLSVVPKVLLDDLLDVVVHGVAGGTGYASGISHSAASRELAREMHVPMPPEAIWRLDGVFGGPAELLAAQSSDYQRHAAELAQQGRASVAYYLISLGYQGFLSLLKRNALQDIPGWCEVVPHEAVFEMDDNDVSLLKSLARLQRKEMVVPTL